MSILQGLAGGFVSALEWSRIVAMVGGVAWGIIGGAIPGISGAVAMALALPFTFAMDATTALVMLAGVWAGANYGGSIPAILMRIPGTPASAAALLDGYELTRQGKAAKALGVSLVCGTIGGVISIVVLIAMVLPLGEVVLQFGSPETFALAIFALTLLAGLAEASFLKGLASGFVGLLLTTVGLDTLTGSLRFTFGRTELMTGVDVVAAMVGLFAMTEMFYRIAPSRREPDRHDRPRPHRVPHAARAPRPLARHAHRDDRGPDRRGHAGGRRDGVVLRRVQRGAPLVEAARAVREGLDGGRGRAGDREQRGAGRRPGPDARPRRPRLELRRHHAGRAHPARHPARAVPALEAPPARLHAVRRAADRQSPDDPGRPGDPAALPPGAPHGDAGAGGGGAHALRHRQLRRRAPHRQPVDRARLRGAGLRDARLRLLAGRDGAGHGAGRDGGERAAPLADHLPRKLGHLRHPPDHGDAAACSRWPCWCTRWCWAPFAAAGRDAASAATA